MLAREKRDTLRYLFARILFVGPFIPFIYAPASPYDGGPIKGLPETPRYSINVIFEEFQ